MEDRYDEVFGPKWSGYLSFRNVIAPDDYLLGTEIGVVTPSKKLTFFASFDARPFRKRILNFQGGNLFYQNTEERYFAGMGGEYHWYIESKNYGGFIQVNANYTWGRYGGMELRPPGGFVLVPRVGVFWEFFNHVYLKAGYAYLDTKNNEVDKHRFYLAVSGIFSLQ